MVVLHTHGFGDEHVACLERTSAPQLDSAERPDDLTVQVRVAGQVGRSGELCCGAVELTRRVPRLTCPQQPRRPLLWIGTQLCRVLQPGGALGECAPSSRAARRLVE